jgi:hypothetical protein
MDVAQHAGRILAAWNIADTASFEQELENALHSCQRPGPVNYLECEQREVLESVVEQLRAMHSPHPAAADDRYELAGISNVRQPASHCLHVGFALLEHLCQRAA